jgi:tetratricopeptide (TPR) repeat protein
MGEFNWGSTLWHEIAHVITLGTTDNRIPRWLTEGLSVYEERRAREGWGEEATPGFLMAYLEDRLLPVSRINDGFVRPTYPEQISHSYFQASLVCELIERDQGFDAILRMLQRYREGARTPEVMRTVLGVEPEEFDRRFTDYLEERYATPLAALEPAASAHREESEGGLAAVFGGAAEDPVDAADADPQNYFAQLRAGLALAKAGRGGQAVPYLERAVELFPEFAEAGGPYFPLAEAYAAEGDTGRAIATLEAMISRNESHVPAYARLSELLESQGQLAPAAEALASIAWVDPLEPDLQRQIAELWERAGLWERAVPARRAVVELRPVDLADALYRLAVAYRHSGDPRMARRTVLRALEIAPGFPEAQELLLALRADRGEASR